MDAHSRLRLLKPANTAASSPPANAGIACSRRSDSGVRLFDFFAPGSHDMNSWNRLRPGTSETSSLYHCSPSSQTYFRSSLLSILVERSDYRKYVFFSRHVWATETRLLVSHKNQNLDLPACQAGVLDKHLQFNCSVGVQYSPSELFREFEKQIFR